MTQMQFTNETTVNLSNCFKELTIVHIFVLSIQSFIKNMAGEANMKL